MCHWFYRTTKLEYARYANNMLLMLKKLTKYWTSDNNNRSRQFFKRNRQIQHFILLDSNNFVANNSILTLLDYIRTVFWSLVGHVISELNIDFVNVSSTCVYHSVLIQLHKIFFFNCREKEMRKILDAFHRKKFLFFRQQIAKISKRIFLKSM